MEQDYIDRGFGLWSKPGVPRKGWVNVGVEDLEESRKICDMCGKTEIRYVHIMSHENYPDYLEVGCICAGHLENDYDSPRKRESEIKSRSAKRKRWCNLPWKISKKNQFYIKKDGYSIIILDKGDYFMGMIVDERTQIKYWTRGCKDTNEAKLLSFDRITALMASSK
ncbi:hypothetical protein DEL18_000661 [Escherichia coli]|nr:hypothetical protein [Escherichia coli]